MTYQEFCRRFGLEGRVLSIRRVKGETPTRGAEVFSARCSLSAILYALKGHEVVLTEHNSPCKGGLVGLGLRDGLPDIPGGFGHFISYGRGEGFRPGERLKANPECGERMILSQPQRVAEGFDGVRLSPYAEGDGADTVALFCGPDQLSAMIYLFHFSKDGSRYDTAIAPAVSGCASLFRIPFGELERDEPRAVIGLTDINARVHFPADWTALTVSAGDFARMLRDAGESFVTTPLWEQIAARHGDGW